MKLFTAKQIKEWDDYTIHETPMLSIELMELAAEKASQWIIEQLSAIQHKDPIQIIIFCGKGNNGGDGLVIARHLLLAKWAVKVYILETEKIGKPDFETNLIQLKALQPEIYLMNDGKDFPVFAHPSLIIDCLFGTGLNKALSGICAALVEHINESKIPVISIDLPAGMFADKSSITQPMIKASYTLSFENYKMAFLLPENENYLGEIKILPIGLDTEFEKKTIAQFQLIDKPLIQKIYRPRKAFAHKGNFGHALIMAGSHGKMGAAILAARACLRAGVGLLTMEVPAIGNDIIQITVPEAMVITAIEESVNKYNAIGIGPGIGTSAFALVKIQNILTSIQNRNTENSSLNNPVLVLDADALNLCAANPHLLELLPPNSILSPHVKEFERLFGKSSNDWDRINCALKNSNKYHCYIILKGHHSFIACPDGTGYFNNTGNAGMATAGSGDTLTGILTGLAAQRYTSLETCILGVYLHGLAGDMALKQQSMESMLAGDIIDFLGQAYSSISLE